jgi:sulfur carrier protein ThiS
MKVALKLFATLSDYLPAEARTTNRLELELDGDTTIARIIEDFRLPPKLVHLVLVNGVFIPPSERAHRKLAGGDTLAIWPPVAGG